MNPTLPPEPPNGDDNGLPPLDLASPAAELLDFEAEPSPQFLTGVRNKIDRRRTTGQLVSFSWDMPRAILLEMVNWISQLGVLFGSTSEKTKGN